MRVIRKFLNIPNSSERKLINSEFEKALKLIEQKKKEHNSKVYAYTTSTNKICRCGGSTVDKIRQTKGSGYVSGNLFGVYGSSSVDTYAVNHCSKCGHEWTKQKYHYQSDKEIAASMVWNINYYIDNSHSWNKSDFNLFKDFHAETIRKIVLWSETYKSDEVTLGKLRVFFKSIYDK